jgi:hypothetical protein
LGAIGYVTSTIEVGEPANPDSTFFEHTYDEITGLDLSGAHNPEYAKYLSGK